MQFDDVKTTVKEHPVETVAIVAGVSVLGYLYYQRRQDKKRAHELELAKIQAITPPKCNHTSRRHRRKYGFNVAA